jgi:methionyl aminopeptidase
MITKDSEEINLLRDSGKILAQTLVLLATQVKPGLPASVLDELAEQEIIAKGGRPSFKNYAAFADGPKFPAALCISINDEIVHGIPGKKILKEGDIVGLDLGVEYKGFYTDAAITVPVGKIDNLKTKLVACANECLSDALMAAVAGNYTGDIGFAIERRAKKYGFSVVRDLVGHGVGKSVHEDPEVPCFGTPGAGTKLVSGMVLAIEPMINAGLGGIHFLSDGWTVKTIDGKPSAHVEHTVLIKKGSCEIITSV